MTPPTRAIPGLMWSAHRRIAGPALERPLSRWLPWLLLAVGVALKLRLLTTSQGIADGDEAVEGLMARHLLLFGERAVYPWGVRYGAGVGLEVQLAAILFNWLGDSSFTLKLSGLILWLACLYLLVSAAASRYGPWTAALAGMLYAAAPQGAQWSLKLAGGHQVAVLLSLLLLFLWARRLSANWVSLLAPLAAISHPIAAPFAAGFAAATIASAEKPARWRLCVLLALSSAACALLLWPREQSVHDPAAFAPLQILRAVPSLLLALSRPTSTRRPRPPDSRSSPHCSGSPRSSPRPPGAPGAIARSPSCSSASRPPPSWSSRASSRRGTCCCSGRWAHSRSRGCSRRWRRVGKRSWARCW